MLCYIKVVLRVYSSLFVFNVKGWHEFTVFNSHMFLFCMNVLKDHQLDKSVLNGRLWWYLSQVLRSAIFLTSHWGLWASLDFRTVQKIMAWGCDAFVATSIDHELLSCAKSSVWLLQKRGLQPPSRFLPVTSCSQGTCSPWLCDPYNQKKLPPEWAGWKIKRHKIHSCNHHLFSFFAYNEHTGLYL